MLQQTSQEVIDGFKQVDSATVFNAVVKKLGGWDKAPVCYTGPEVRCLLPELGRAVGHAVTAEVTTNDPDSVAIPSDEYYDFLDQSPVPMIAVLKDVDSRPGRGAIFGDGMATLNKALGVTGVVAEGSVRDLMGIKDVGLPMWGTGTVPGHGPFHLVRLNSSITVGQLRIDPGDLLVADDDGCTKVPSDLDPDEILGIAREIQGREQRSMAMVNEPGFTIEKWKKARSR